MGKFLPILNSCSKVPLPLHTQKQYECSSLSTSLLVFALFHSTFTDIEVLSPKEICTFCWGKFLTIVLNVCLFMAIYLKKKITVNGRVPLAFVHSQLALGNSGGLWSYPWLSHPARSRAQPPAFASADPLPRLLKGETSVHALVPNYQQFLLLRLQKLFPF